MMHYLTDPLQYAFIQRAMISGVIIGILCASWGTFIVLRRMALVGHALGHTALPGLVIAYLLKGSLLLGAFVSILATSLGIGFLAKDEKIYEDTSGGMFTTVMFAFGVLLISTTKSYRDLFSMLFGNILGVTNADFILIVLIAVFALAVLFLFFKELKLFSVDPGYAKTIGIPVNVLRYGLLVFLSLTVVAGIQAVGIILTNALLIVPVAAARLLTDKLKIMIFWSCAFAVFAVLGGIYASFYCGIAAGAAIVLICALIFALVWACKNIWRWKIFDLFIRR